MNSQSLTTPPPGLSSAYGYHTLSKPVHLDSPLFQPISMLQLRGTALRVAMFYYVAPLVVVVVDLLLFLEGVGEGEKPEHQSLFLH